MNWFYLSFFLTIIGPVIYHLTQKVTPANVNPLVSIMISYISALILTLIGLLVHPPAEGMRTSLRALNWTSVVLGTTLVMTEIGFMLAYRSGGSLSSFNMIRTAAVSISLVIIGLFIFREPLTFQKIAGIALCVAGLALVGRG